MSTERAEIGFTPALDPGEESSVKGIALAAELPFARAHPLSFFLGGLLHGLSVRSPGGAGTPLGPKISHPALRIQCSVGPTLSGSVDSARINNPPGFVCGLPRTIVRVEKRHQPFFFGLPEAEVHRAARLIPA